MSLPHPTLGPDQWIAVDRYLESRLTPTDATLEAALADAAAAGLPPISVTPLQGKFLMLLVMMTGAKRVLEIGTLGGYSTIWLARALQGGRDGGGMVLTLEVNPEFAKVAAANIARAGVSEMVDIRLGRALDTLPDLAEEREHSGGAFDLIFIDADKASTPEYFTWALRLSKRGTVIVVDNVIREGGVIDAASSDANVQGMRRFVEMLGKEPRVTATALQTVGAKGYDGFAVALVTS